MDKHLSAYQQIQQALEWRTSHRYTWPEQVLVPPEMFAEFQADVHSTGHAETIWDVPVVAGNVKEIAFVGSEYVPPWWQFWRKRPERRY